MLPRPQCSLAQRPQNGPRCYYLTKGYYPALQKGEAENPHATDIPLKPAAVLTLAGSYDDWAVGNGQRVGKKKTTGKHSMHAPSIIKMYE